MPRPRRPSCAAATKPAQDAGCREIGAMGWLYRRGEAFPYWPAYPWTGEGAEGPVAGADDLPRDPTRRTLHVC